MKLQAKMLVQDQMLLKLEKLLKQMKISIYLWNIAMVATLKSYLKPKIGKYNLLLFKR